MTELQPRLAAGNWQAWALAFRQIQRLRSVASNERFAVKKVWPLGQAD